MEVAQIFIALLYICVTQEQLQVATSTMEFGDCSYYWCWIKTFAKLCFPPCLFYDHRMVAVTLDITSIFETWRKRKMAVALVMSYPFLREKEKEN